ncbi:hypothetical protein O181_065772 [Austropuccinia psidii MF-1]|uniref:Uncharacterized protein n=1 Tax=Austropuccinia psidii MF-1 TaxID=1389203 RepID=A0A9Q3EU46_9BASI|nr:hypothetical protein [Austropuccinia psidii MF-1]
MRNTVEILVEENFQIYPTPTVKKKRKYKKLFSQGPTIQDSEKEVPNNSSNQMYVDSEVPLIPQKGKKGKIPSGTEYTQQSVILQRKVPEIPIISEPELELSIRHSTRDKEH